MRQQVGHASSTTRSMRCSTNQNSTATILAPFTTADAPTMKKVAMTKTRMGARPLVPIRTERVRSSRSPGSGNLQGSVSVSLSRIALAHSVLTCITGPRVVDIINVAHSIFVEQSRQACRSCIAFLLNHMEPGLWCTLLVPIISIPIYRDSDPDRSVYVPSRCNQGARFMLRFNYRSGLLHRSASVLFVHGKGSQCRSPSYPTVHDPNARVQDQPIR